jgi:hypothetical protein
MRTARLFAVGLLLLLSGSVTMAQQLRLGSNPYTVVKSAVLELQSTNQGLLLSRISDTTLINVLSPPDGMLIYFIPAKQVMIRANGSWQPMPSVKASAATSGWLSSTDWNTFNNKAASFTTGNLTETGSGILTITGGTNAVTGSGTTIQVKQASSIQGGFLSSADWSAFNNKWGLNGNTVTAVKNFGTIDNYDLPFITNNTERMRIDGSGNVGIGTNAPSTLMHIKTGTAGNSGLRMENLTTSSAVTTGAATIGVDATGKVVRTKTPLYYTGTGTTANTEEVTKIWLAEIFNTATGIVTVNIPANVGFSNILGIQLTTKGGTTTETAPIAMVTSNTTSSVTIRVLESKNTGILLGGNVEGLEAHVNTATKIYVRVEGY